MFVSESFTLGKPAELQSGEPRAASRLINFVIPH